MQTKPKACKGLGIAKGYGCGKPTIYRTNGLGKMCGCYSDWLLNSENGKIKLSKATIKATKPRIELEQANTQKRQKDSLKLAKLNTKTIVHEFVRLRDKGKPCISCNAEWHSEFQCGHHYKAETFETLKYNLDNLHGQCIRCNIHLQGNFDNYALNLPNRIGHERYNGLVELAMIDKQQSKVWDFESLKEIRDNIKELKKQLNV